MERSVLFVLQRNHVVFVSDLAERNGYSALIHDDVERSERHDERASEDSGSTTDRDGVVLLRLLFVLGVERNGAEKAGRVDAEGLREVVVIGERHVHRVVLLLLLHCRQSRAKYPQNEVCYAKDKISSEIKLYNFLYQSFASRVC